MLDLIKFDQNAFSFAKNLAALLWAVDPSQLGQCFMFLTGTVLQSNCY